MEGSEGHERPQALEDPRRDHDGSDVERAAVNHAVADPNEARPL